ncbi:MAG TPA: type 1 glutamine amidotransferase domain-containing protein [Solirubrobacterales bacterium]|nr:type 1 glutamine amidotransferase domain-containing protein [Solirubrobacterales bacterium]
MSQEQMNQKLKDKRVAILVANEGVEEIELKGPLQALRDAGAEVDLVAPEEGQVQAFNHLDKGSPFTVDRTVSEVSSDEYAALVLPGGVANPDNLRTHEDAVAFAGSFFEAGKPVGAICHAPWTLVEAGVLEGRTLTLWPSLKTDIENAGATWVDEEVHVDGEFVTSRRPDDLESFCHQVVETIAAA